jgi:hypothetical protein
VIRSVTPLLGLAILWSVVAGAGEDWPPYFVGEVVVAGETEDPTAATGTVSVLEADDIRKLGAATVAEALRHLAGASMSAGARDEQRVWVRGYEPSDVPVLLGRHPDRRPLLGRVDLNQVPVGDVARIVLARERRFAGVRTGRHGRRHQHHHRPGRGAAGYSADLDAADHSTVRPRAAPARREASDWYVGVG